MTVYNINLGIGWASSGVEYAQAYRASVFREIGVDAKFVFMDMFQAENLQHFTANIGFKDEEIIWLYSHFTDVKIAETTYPLAELEKTLPADVAEIERQPHMVRYRASERDFYVTVFFRKDREGIVQRVEYVSKGLLIRKDYFSYTRVFSEYYAPKDNKATVYRRVFFNEDGSIAYEENCDGDTSIFRMGNDILYSKDELVTKFMESLQLTSDDVVLLDRSTGIGQIVFRHHGDAKLGVVIHAEHFSVNSTDDQNILWNNYYEYQFSNADKVDAFIASTETQKAVLSGQFEKYTSHRPYIAAIPVGSLDKLREGERKPYSLVTGSRLASEKHIDWLVSAVVLAHETLPEVTFDIYGEGGQRGSLQEQIKKANASDYIQLKGHQDLTEVYKNYDVYLTGSTSEGFGLTLLEAIGSGLPLIGLDVPYGNQTFIADGENGFLIPRGSQDDAQTYARAYADKIIELYRQHDLAEFHRVSYQRADGFLHDKIETKWSDFVKEMVSK